MSKEKTGTIEWVVRKIEKMQETMLQIYKSSLSVMTLQDINKMNRILDSTKKKISAIDTYSDISTYGYNSIFTIYAIGDKKETFEDYFCRNLSTDIACAGFLETLDVLIELSQEREVIVATNGSDEQESWKDTLKKYLSMS